MKISSKGFTLVELIVVITILAILGSIAFVSLVGYSGKARNSNRKLDLQNVISSLELFSIKTGFYPTPSNQSYVKYLGAEVWTQGTVGDSLIINLSGLTKKPVDPLTQSEYTYSRVNTKHEYQIAAIFETEFAQRIINQANAVGDKISNAYVKGNYNGLIIKVSTGATIYILAVPSIVASELNIDLIDIVTQKKFVYNNFSNLPPSYSGTIYKIDGGFDFTPNSLVVYSSGNLNQLTNQNNLGIQADFIKDLQDSYSGTIIIFTPDISPLISTEINTIIPSRDARNLITHIINYYVSENISKTYVTVNGANTGGSLDCTGTTITGITYPLITYIHPSLNDLDTQIGTGTNTILYGIENYTGSISCNAGIKNINNENKTTNCNTGYSWNGNNCEAGTNTFTCASKPAIGTIWNTVSSYTQTWNGTTWLPIDSTTTYNTTPSIINCNYICNTGYSWDGTNCILVAVGDYPGCNKPDITFGGITIAACNVGTNIASTSHNDSNGYGELFQWGNNAGIKYVPTSNTRIGVTTDNSTFSNPFFIQLADWTSITNNNLWGDNSGAGTDLQRKGPCAAGYHVPAISEWVALRTAGGWSLATGGLAMSNALKLPHAGYRNTNNGAYNNGGIFGYYSSSSPNDAIGPVYTQSMVFDSANIYQTGNASRSSGHSVRCFKN